MEQIKAIGVIGAGQMGAGIAQVFATAGYDTQLFDSIPGQVEKAVGGIEKSLSKLVEKNQITAEQKDGAKKNLKIAKSLSDLASADFVVEAIVENTEIKLQLFRELDSITKPTAILASNTSSISITKIAGSTKRPDKVIGMHFMNPVPLMKLVEVIRGLQTADSTLEVTKGLVTKLGKTAVTVNQDYPGFVVNRILIPMLNEAIYVLMEKLATPEEIDTAMKLGTNQPMGPLELADLVGLDTCLAICQILHSELGDDKYRPCPLLAKYVEAGWLGRKTQRGFYDYRGEVPVPTR